MKTQRKKILLYVRDGSIRECLVSFLERNGNEVVPFHNINELLGMFSDVGSFDVALMEPLIPVGPVGNDLDEPASGEDFVGEIYFEMIRQKLPASPAIILINLERKKISGEKSVEGATGRVNESLPEENLNKLTAMLDTIPNEHCKAG